jgi:hypothetical protein
MLRKTLTVCLLFAVLFATLLAAPAAARGS